MLRPIALTLVCLYWTVAGSGCTHVQLRNDALNQAVVVHQLQQQQVLDNLAMFAADPNAVPYFTIVGAATSAVSDTGSAATNLSWLRSGFQSIGLMLGGQRLNQENFTLAPVSAPEKLARMRCAYQLAIGAGGSHCIDCCELERKWGEKKWTGRPPSGECIDECSVQPGWFGVGCKKDVPECACYVGHYCDTYVWVLPDGTDEFARLMLAILDYATGVVVPPQMMSVKTTTKYDPTGTVLERTIEESTSKPAAAPAAGLPAADVQPTVPGTQLRQEFFLPAPLPQVVIPLQSAF